MRATWPALLAFAALAGCVHSESLRVSFDHSEWHPPSFLAFDVSSGGFNATFRDGTHDIGRFSADEMRRIRVLLDAAKARGFVDRTCLHTPPSEREFVVVSNGGRQWLDFRQGAAALHAPADLDCWTAEAIALHDLIGSILANRGDDWTMPRMPRGPHPTG
jgi:hypothetical protein